MLVITAFYASRGTRWGTFISKKSFESLTFFRNWAAEIWSLTGSFRQCLKNCNLPVPINDLRKNNFFQNIFFSNYFPIVSKAIPAFWWKTSSRVVKSSFYLSRVTVWKLLKARKISFFIITWDSEQKIFRTLAKLFIKGCQNGLLPVRKKSLGKNIFRKKFLFSWIVPELEQKNFGVLA